MHTTAVGIHRKCQVPEARYLTICRDVGARTLSALFLDMLIIIMDKVSVLVELGSPSFIRDMHSFSEGCWGVKKEVRYFATHL